MEVVRLFSASTVDLETKVWPVVETALVAQKSLALLLLAIGCEINLFLDALGVDTRFPLGEVNRVTKPNAENKDANETDGADEQDDDNDDESTDDEDEDSDEDDDDDDSDDDDDDDESDDDGVPGDNAGDNGDDDSDEDDDNDEDVDEDTEDEDGEEDAEGNQAQPPSKKKK